MTTTDQLKGWLESVISGIVDFPNDIEITQEEDAMGILYSVKVNKPDLGKVIGKEGSIANALRVLLRSAGRMKDLRCSLKIDAGTKFELSDDKR